MPSVFQGLTLTAKGEVKQAKLSAQGAVMTLDDIQKYLKKKTEPDYIGCYSYKSKHLHLFGYQKGKAGTENKHELPPPHDSLLLFGDILILVTASADSYSQPIPFKPADYEAFYTHAFGGFEDLDDEEDLEEDEEEEDEELDEKQEKGDAVDGEADVDAEEEVEEDEDEVEAEEDQEEEEGNVADEVDDAMELGETPVRSTRSRSRRKKGADNSKNLTASTKLNANFLEGYKKSSEQLVADTGSETTVFGA